MTTSPSFAQMANNQSISLSSALRANTPPTKGQTTSRKFLTLSIFFLLSFFCTTNAWGATTTYTFTSNKWADSSKGWTSGKDGVAYLNSGVQVTEKGTGAYATSKTSFTNISKIDVKYCTNASKGAGTIVLTVGSTSKTLTVSKTGGTTMRTISASFDPNVSGTVKITVNCTTNSIYVGGITITTAAATTFTVAYNANGGSGTMSNSTGSSISLKECTFTAPYGKEFKEWNTNASGNGTSYQPGDIVTESLDLYAIWQELPKYTVKFYKTSTTFESDTEASAGEGVTPPTMEKECGEWIFMGWSESSSNSENSTTPLSVVTLTNEKYYPTKDIDLYPVYIKSEGGGGTVTWDKITTAPTDWSGEYLIVNSNYAMTSDFYSGTSGEFKGASVTVSNNQVTSSPSDKMIWIVEKNGSSAQYSFKNKSTGTYAKITGTSSTNAALSSSVIWFTISSSSTSGVWKINSVDNSTRCFSYYSNNKTFRTYANSSNTTGSLYRKVGSGSTTYYYSYPECVPTCTDPALAYTTATITKTVGDAAFINSLTNSNRVDVEYTSANTNVATVDNVGQVTIKAVGETTIKATWEGSTDYCADEASYTLTVNPKTYTITVANNISNGSISADKSSAVEGATIKLTAKPNTGYKLDTWNVKDASNNSVSVNANGEFTMPASNVTVSATFVAIPQLDTPTNLSATDVTTTAATLTWDWIDNENSQYLNGYNLYYKKVGDANFTGPITCNSKSSTRNGLTPNTEYVFKVAATSNNINECKSSEQSAEFTFKTKDLTQLAKPTNLPVTNITCTEATLSWDAVTNKKNYKLTYTDGVSTKEVTTGSESVTLNNLLSGTTYTWEIQAIGDGTNYANSEVADGGSFTTNYKITYNVKSGTWTACEDGCVANGYDFTICSTTPTKTGYNFMGWSTADDQIAEYQAEETIENVSANITLYAVWKLKTYTITWVANGQEFHKQEDATHGTDLAVPSAPDPETYACDDKVFVGWTATQINGSTDTEPADLFTTKTAKVEDAATTYYAVFATAGSGGGGAPVETTTTLDFSAQGYENGDVVTSLTQGDVTITLDKGSNSNDTKYFTTGTAVRVYGGGYFTVSVPNESTISKITLVFGSGDGSNAITASTGSYTSETWTGSASSVTFSISGSSGHRRIKTVSVTFATTTQGSTSYSDYVTTCVQVTKYNVNYNIGDGATGAAPTETSKAEGTIFTLASADGISKEGYSFAGWLCDNDGNIYGASEEYTMPAANVTFTAQWNELPKYTVTFNNKGKKHSEVTQTIANAPIECPTGLVACDGYSFAGWSTEQLDGVSTFTKIEDEYTPESDITLYAVYAEGNATTNGWVKVTDLSTITEGTYALLSNNNYAFNGTINNNSDGEHTTNSFVFNGEGVASEAPSGTCEIELIASGDGFKMYSEGKGYLYAKAAKSGNLAWQQNENRSWSWDSTKDNWVYAENNAFLRSYNNTFRTYGTNNGNAIYFAKKNVTSFTTSPACDPMITIGSEAPVMVTSANGIRVDAVQNITIAATNLDQDADEAQVSIKIVSNNSAFKFKEVGANGDGQVTSTWTGIANATFDKTLCVTYTPTVSGREETATLTVTAYRHNGSTEYATATMQVRGRSLPEQFVLVANTTDGWVALPNTLGTGSSSSIPYPIAVEVDNDADPTSIPLAPSTTIYKAAARSTVNAIPTGLRFTTETGGYMQASTTETNIWLASNNSENMQSWTLNSTDFVDYSIRVNNAAEGHYLNYSNTQKKIGNYKSDNKLRILPVGAVCEQHAAPEDIEASSVRATSATIQWSAVSTATAGYEYRIGATGEWTKIGNVTELEITGLDPLTNYVVYVRASVEGAIINCSNEAKVSFTTVNCDDVPTNITHTSSSQSITVSWEAKAATSIVKLYSDKEGTTEVKSIESSSPCTLSDLEKYTTYYVQILAGGTCPSQIIEVSTLIPNINIAEWMEDGILVDVDTDEDVSVIIENEESYGSGSGQVAEDLFFSKYFEATGNVKLLALYNGTNADIDLTQYSIKFSNKGKDYTGSDYTEVDYEATVDLSEDLPENRRTLIAGQELILISYANDGSSNSKPITNPDGTTSNVNQSDYGVLACAAENKQESGWDRYIRVTSPALNFSGNDAIALYKNTELIDIIGGGNASKANMTTVVSPAQTFMDAAGWYNAAGYEIVDLKPSQNKDYALSTNRCLLVRLNSVISGAKAVEKNTTDFVTLGGEFGEWMGKQIPDDDAACDGFKYVGGYNYSEYYTKYNTVGSEQVFPGENRTDGTVKITIEGLPNYSCHNIKLNLKIGEDLKLTEITKVPILISDEQTTKITSSTFTTLKSTLGVIDPETKEKTDLTDEQLIEKCETCDIVVLANGKLTHETDGIDQFRDLTIYPEGTFNNTSDFTVNRLLVHAKLDEVGCAIVENNGVTLTTNAIAHTKRIDAKYWYPFSLPYNCNIADIKQASGESMGTYGVHWGIQYYDGQRRQASGTSAGIGQSSNFWTPMGENDQLNAYQGYVIALFDDAVEKETDMRTIYFPPVVEQMYTESGTDSKETTITSWNVNLEAEKRHHGWNFTGSPYISVFNPQATGLSEDRGLFSEVLIVSGHYDQGSNEYLYDDEYVYVSIPSPNGAKYYDQYITSATSLKPFTAYFVQAIDPKSGNDETQTLAYAKAGRELPTSAPRRSTSTRQRVLVELGVTAPDGQTDNTGIWVDEKYTSAYEIAADLTKMYVAGDRPQLYTMAADNEKMAYNALPDEMAGNVQLGIYAPTAGSYTLFINERVSRLKGVERVDLLYNNVVVADLLSSAYVIDVPKKGAVNGYTISVCRKANVTTAIDNISGQPIKIITGDGYLTLEGIVSDAQVSVYDMLGRLVAAQNANDETNIRIPFIVQGVYNVVVKNEQGMTTIKVVLR